jgi:hypothetical protein
MSRILLLSLLAAWAALRSSLGLASDPTLSGPTGLLTVPSAEVAGEGAAAFAFSDHNPRPADLSELQNYLFTAGFLPGLEVGGRLAEAEAAASIRDLSFHAKYRFLSFTDGPSFAIGGQDIGGEAQFFRSRYGVMTWPWRSVSVTAGYGFGPDVFDGPLGGLEWRPWSWVGLLAEYDAEDFNAGVKLQSPPIWGGLRGTLTVAHRGLNDEVEYGAGISFQLGRAEPGKRGIALKAAPELPAKEPLTPALSPQAGRGSKKTEGVGLRSDPGPVAVVTPAARLRAALEQLGFESVRTGTRGADVLVVSLENRRYNHAAVDGLGLALGTIATHAGPAVQQIELTQTVYWVPQVTITVPAQLYRDFLNDAAVGPALAQAIEVRHADDAGAATWDNDAASLNGVELVAEPVLRTFAGTESGVLDYGLGARLRLTAPMATGLLFHGALQAPLLLSEDFRDGRNFSGFAPEGGIDLLALQYHHKLLPGWALLWSAGRTKIFRSDLNMAGLEQLWLSPQGQHQFQARLLHFRGAAGSRDVALGGYTFFDPSRRYSLGLTAGRFYGEDGGFRLELNRYFGDTIVGFFFKAASQDDQAAGFQISLPLTPRRDARPGGVQLKGPRRWGHSLSSTVNDAEGRNPLRPLLLYEPRFDLELRRDFYDAGRLAPAAIRADLPRMREAYWLWAGGG